jgi:hypothetical protein
MSDERHPPRPVPGKPLRGGTNIYGIKVVGNSMTGDDIHDGDIIFVDPDAVPQDGDIAVILIKNYRDPYTGRTGSHRTVKRLSHGGTVLKSSNPTVPPIVLQPDSGAIVEGRVVGAGHMHDLIRVTITRADVPDGTSDDPRSRVRLTGITAGGHRVSFNESGRVVAKVRAEGQLTLEFLPSQLLTGEAE